ncbi:MAG: radical SAM protein [Anaerolineales bacterium]|nr:radical SAM protein [Anaerolineales bacterium]
MKIIASAGTEDVAMVYIGEMENGNLVEFVESVQPPIPREKKWVLLVSTLFGCPVGCAMCDAGGYYKGKPTRDEILAQIDYLVHKRFPHGRVPCEQFKIQFARMGEPALNDSVLDALEELPRRYEAPGLMPSISTIAPAGREAFFERLLEIHSAHYMAGHFQFQFSIHTTDPDLRQQMMPVRKWDFAQMAAYGERFYAPGERKITLNFALAQGMPVDPAVLLEHFNPDIFLIKITPLNPTYKARENGLASYIQPAERGENYPVINDLRQSGYQVILSIGHLEENLIGSNCGQYIKRHITAAGPVEGGYTYCLQEISES